jgi:hypothetical protein
VLVLSSISQPDWECSSFFVLVSIFTLQGFYKNWNQLARKAEFYDNYFLVHGKGMEKEVAYSEITKVSKVRTTEFFLSPIRIHVSIASQSSDLVIFGDPKNRDLNPDLFRWLTKQS